MSPWLPSPKVFGLLVAAAAVLGLVTPAQRAQACGGLFCNRPPINPLDPLPVAQAGENVVFGVDGDPAHGDAVVTAHIQILYTGDVAQFSWVVPVARVPELSTGTDRLFSALGAPTQPTFAPQNVYDGTCIPEPSRGMGGSAGAIPGSGGATGTNGTGGVVIAFQGAVGPYDAVVLQSSSSDELASWLSSNGYYLDPHARRIIDAYVSEGKYFVALKLTNGQDVRSIRPIVLTFHGADPCVPLRLTAIAALPDMNVTVYVLGRARAVPQGFLELKLDELRIDWPGRGANYADLLKEAANDAGGDAFVTEYAGASSVIGPALWAPARFDADKLRAAPTPPLYVQQLVAQQLANDSQTLPLLEKYIPMPQAAIDQGITPRVFYANLSTYWIQFAFPPFDLGGLTDHVVSDIIEPRRLAQQMIDGHAYLTRLGTFISPEEMKADAIFAFNDTLPDVPSLHTATLRFMCGASAFMPCNAPVRLELPDGRMAWLRQGAAGTTCQGVPYDTSLKALPAAEIVWQRGLSGEGTRTLDNGAAIQTALAAHNAAFLTGNPPPIPGSGGASAGAGGAGGGAGNGDGGGGGPGLGGSTGIDGLGPKNGGSSGVGCGCALAEGRATSGVALLALPFVLLALRLRGRRHRPR